MLDLVILVLFPFGLMAEQWLSLEESLSCHRRQRLWERHQPRFSQLPEGRRRIKLHATVNAPDKQRIISMAVDARKLVVYWSQDDDKVRRWSLKDGDLTALSAPEPFNSGVIALSANGQSLVAASLKGSPVRIWKDTSRNRSFAFTVKYQRRAVGISATGDTVAAARSPIGGIDILDAVKGELKETLTWDVNPPDYARCLDFSDDGKLIAAGHDDGMVRIWDRSSGRRTAQLVGHKDSLLAIKFDHQGGILASAAFDGTLRIWNVARARLMYRLTAEADSFALAINKTGTLLAAGGTDGHIRLWHLATGQEYESIEGHTDKVVDVAFSDSGEFMFSASLDGTIKVWQLPQLDRR